MKESRITFTVNASHKEQPKMLNFVIKKKKEKLKYLNYLKNGTKIKVNENSNLILLTM